ncbi:hypothetical protein AAMO2058_000756000 [Amorphochlora amoebiformis]
MLPSIDDIVDEGFLKPIIKTILDYYARLHSKQTPPEPMAMSMPSIPPLTKTHSQSSQPSHTYTHSHPQPLAHQQAHTAKPAHQRYHSHSGATGAGGSGVPSPIAKDKKATLRKLNIRMRQRQSDSSFRYALHILHISYYTLHLTLVERVLLWVEP